MREYDRFARGYRIPVRTSRDFLDTTPIDVMKDQAVNRETEEAATGETYSSVPETDWRDQALRLQAEMVNFRKRQDRRVEEATSNERGRLLNRLLPVLDNFDRLMAHKEESRDETMWQGVELTHRELTRFLEAEGVRRIAVLGEAFDPEEHEAVATIVAPVVPGTVIEELKPGYLLGDKLLRPAQVVVAAE
jgi:molecular chaperone GrpE